jgi:hypothetical protein
MGWATFWANFSQTHQVTLSPSASKSVKKISEDFFFASG